MTVLNTKSNRIPNHLENIQTHSIAESKEEIYQSKVVFMGDVILARSIGDLILSGKDPFINISETINKFDLRVANIETTIAEYLFFLK